MRTQVTGFVIGALIATSVAFGKPVAPPTIERVLHVTNGETPQDLQEIATTIRAVGNIGQVSVDPTQGTVAVRGTADQIAFAEWLVNELDRPAGVPLPANLPSHEYRMAGSNDDVVRVFYLPHSDTPQKLQELTTLIRHTADVPRIFSCNTRRAVTVRAAAATISIAEWLVKELDRPADGPLPANLPAHEYRTPGPNDDMVRVFYLPYSDTPQKLQELVTLIRHTADVPRIFSCNAHRAIAVRGAAVTISITEWLVKELDRPGDGPLPANLPAHEYRTPGVSDDVVRVFYFAHGKTPQELQKVAVNVRTSTKAERLFVNNAQSALALRGTVDQIATAERLIDEAR